MRAKYMARFIFRLAVLAVILAMYLLKSESFNILSGFNFFKHFTLLHIVWAIWIVSMIMQVIPTKGLVSIGSQKHFAIHYADTNLSHCSEHLTRREQEIPHPL